MTAIMAMEGVCLSFGRGAKTKRALDNLTFAVRRDETFGFLGPSGAGKTTTIKLLTRQLAKDAGRIQLFGRLIENASDADYERIGILSDTSALYERMSIADNLAFHAKLHGVPVRSVAPLLERMGLAKDAKTLIKNCSKGMRQRAALCAALVHSPELLFLDEPTSGLDPASRAEVHRMFAELRAGGTTIFLTTHDMAEAEACCDRVAILDAGRIVACDAPRALELAHAHNRLTVCTRTRGTIETSKDAAGAATVAELMAADEVVSMHTDEPDLEEVFLELTGREF